VISRAPQLAWKSLNDLKDHLVPLVEAGVRGFKCFMIESGVEVRNWAPSLQLQPLKC